MADDVIATQLGRMTEQLRENAKQDENRARIAERANQKQNSVLESVNLGIFKQFKIAEAEKKRAKADKLEALEKQREAKTVGESASVARERIGKGIEEPSFLGKIFKLALGIFGAAVFIKLVQNFDQVKAFTTDKLVPALKSTFSFLKDVLTPVFEFISNNFSGVVTGVAVAAGAVIGARIFIKLANLFKNIFVAFQVIRTFAVGMLRNVLMIGNQVISVVKLLGGKIIKAFRLLVSVAGLFRNYMMMTFIPNMIAMFKSMMGKVMGAITKGITVVTTLAKAFRLFMLTTFLPAIGGFIMGLITSLGAVLIPLAIPIAIALGIAAVVAGIGLALTKLRDALGFGSIFDVLMLGVMHLKDAFAHVVNLVGSLVNFILGLVEKFGKFLGFEVDLPEIPKMATDSAAEFKMGAQEAVIKAKEKEEEERIQNMSPRKQQAAERKAKLLARAEAGDPNVTVTRSTVGGFNEDNIARIARQIDERREKERLQKLAAPKESSGGSTANAVVNAPVSTTNVNNATTVMDAEPAVDGLDRFAMGSAF